MSDRRQRAASCATLLRESSASGELAGLAGALQALADPTRLRLLDFVGAQAGAEACVCHLTAPVGLSQPTVSHHLRVLHEAGFLARDKRGAWVHYRLLPERLREVSDALLALSRERTDRGPSRRARKAS